MSVVGESISSGSLDRGEILVENNFRVFCTEGFERVGNMQKFSELGNRNRFNGCPPGPHQLFSYRVDKNLKGMRNEESLIAVACRSKTARIELISELLDT